MPRPKSLKYENPEFKKLKQQWYGKLAKSGFKDIELPGDCAMLQHYDSTRFYRVESDVFGAQQAYYERAGQFLFENAFLCAKQRYIWKEHSEGRENTEIAKKHHIGLGFVAKEIRKVRAKMLDKLDTVISLREGTPEDRTFVYATMLRGVYYGCPQMSLIPKAEFMSNYHQIVTNLLESPTAVLKIACLPDDPECIIGYALGDQRGILHFIFVKTAWRKLGVAKALLKSLGPVKWVTILTRVGERLIKQCRGLHFNPFAVLGGNDNG